LHHLVQGLSSMPTEIPVSNASGQEEASSAAPIIRSLTIQRFRVIEYLAWRPAKGLNVILGGGDVGKTTILDAVALLLSPTNSISVSDTDYYLRDVDAGF